VSTAKVIEEVLEVVTAGEDDTYLDDTQFEQEPEVIEVPIVERVLVVPLDFEPDPALETINLVRRRVPLDAIDNNCSLNPVSTQPLAQRKLSTHLETPDLPPPPVVSHDSHRRNARNMASRSSHSDG
jgi:hypothetical protein